MALTKQWFIDKAYEELGLSAYVFSLQAEDYSTALDRANAWMGQLEGNGVRVGDWPLPDDPTTDSISTVVAIPASNWEVIWTNLALALAPTAGRTPEGPTIAKARDGLRMLLNRRLSIPQMQRPSTMPIGTGWNRGIKDRQFYQQRAVLTDGSGQSLDITVWTQEQTVQPIPNPTP